MTVFAVVGIAPLPPLAAAIHEHYPNSHIQLSPAHWLIATMGTSKELAEKLGLNEKGGGGQAIVYNIAGYNGYAPLSVWEWIKANWGNAPNG